MSQLKEEDRDMLHYDIGIALLNSDEVGACVGPHAVLVLVC